jgi:Flp pilus assembly protein TadG
MRRLVRRAQRRGSDERGVVLVWLAITLVLLLGVTAFSIDVAYWHVTKDREQRAADAAALAGAVTFPNDPAQSDAQAQGVAADNGYTTGAVNPLGANGSCPLTATTTICTGPGDKPYQYKVTVAQSVHNFFGGIFGIGTTTVRATAQAAYIGPLKMGSPSNQFGNDPDTTPATLQTYPNFWANIAGGSSVKQKGDAYAAGYCDIPTDGCSGIGPNKNLDFNPHGYVYAVDFKSGATVDLQAFDPSFVNVGDTCTDATANLAGAAALANVQGYPQGAPNVADRAIRYGSGSRYCTGDNLFTDHGQNGPAPNTTFTVLKASVPGDPNTATSVAGCPPITYTGYSGDIAAALNANLRVGTNGAMLSQVFRQWVTLCNVTGQAGDEYFIQVSTDAASQGHNRFSLRASGAPAGQVAVAGNAYMGLYANVGGGQLTQFYLARVPSGAAGHTLVLNFFDIGDASSTGTLQVVPPPDSNVVGNFSGCQWTGNASGAIGFAANTPTAPWGPLTPINNCLITGVNAPGTTWNAQWSTVTIPIPNNYTCNDGDPNGCWIKINYLFTGGVTDTTSWNASLLGDPVRLVK